MKTAISKKPIRLSKKEITRSATTSYGLRYTVVVRPYKGGFRGISVIDVETGFSVFENEKQVVTFLVDDKLDIQNEIRQILRMLNKNGFDDSMSSSSRMRIARKLSEQKRGENGQ